MSILRNTTLGFSLLLVSTFVGSVISLRELDRLRPAATLEDVLYVSSPKVLKRLSLGYEALVADIYWTRAVQYFGSKHVQNSMQYKLLYPLLDIATTLDPRLIPAYDFGSMFLTQKPPQGAGEPLKAIELLRRGIENNPQEWRLYKDMGFVDYMELRDYQAAGRAFEKASQIPGAHQFLKIMAAKSLQKGGEYETSMMLWQAMYESTRSVQIRENAIKHMRALQVDHDVSALETLASIYKQRTGHLPASFSQMAAEHWIAQVPRDPLGYPYKMMPDGRVEVMNYKKLPFINKGLPLGQQPSELDLSGKD